MSIEEAIATGTRNHPTTLKKIGQTSLHSAPHLASQLTGSVLKQYLYFSFHMRNVCVYPVVRQSVLLHQVK